MKRENTESITIGGIKIEVVRKPIKNMYLRIYPDGRVCVSAPLLIKGEAIASFVRLKEGWIMQKKKKREETPKKPDQAGERVVLWGQEYPLCVVESDGKNTAELKEGKLLLTISKGGGQALVKKVLDGWYRARLYEEVHRMKETLQIKIGASAGEWRIRDMKTRWGSCNINKRRIWLNLKLAKMPPDCLAYVMVHELVHLLERGHNRVFYNYMDRFCPDWKEKKGELAQKARALL
jgi:predicted metal-dependent hydrolase